MPCGDYSFCLMFFTDFSDCVRWTRSRTGTSVLMTHARVRLWVIVHVSVTLLLPMLTSALRRDWWWTGGPTTCAVSLTTYLLTHMTVFLLQNTKEDIRWNVHILEWRVIKAVKHQKDKMTKNYSKYHKSSSNQLFSVFQVFWKC